LAAGLISPMCRNGAHIQEEVRFKMALSTPPTGADISKNAAAAGLDTANKATGVTQGKTVSFTPANLGHVKSMQDLESGQFVGVLQAEIAGDRSGLPPGQYNLFLAKVGNDWHVYAESGSNVVAEAASVVQRSDTQAHMKPKFSEGSFCWWVWLVVTGFQWCF
jgi:hypothetical protein